jgi:hypothetical protein
MEWSTGMEHWTGVLDWNVLEDIMSKGHYIQLASQQLVVVV